MIYHIPDGVIVWRSQQAPLLTDFGTRGSTGNADGAPGIMDSWTMVTTTRAVTYDETEHVATRHTNRGRYEYFRLPPEAKPWTFLAIQHATCMITMDDRDQDNIKALGLGMQP